MALRCFTGEYGGGIEKWEEGKWEEGKKGRREDGFTIYDLRSFFENGEYDSSSNFSNRKS